MNDNRRTGYDRRNEQVRPATERWFGNDRRQRVERRAVMKDPDVTIGRLRIIPVFGDLSMPQYEKLLAITTKHDIVAGETICAIGDFTDRLFIIINGSLRILFQDGRSLSRIIPKDPVGTLGFFTNQKHIATVQADSDCTVLTINREELMRLFAIDHELWARVLGNLVQQLAEKLRDSNRIISDLDTGNMLEML
jgi:CRP/FNR family transcriptional regulator, cyclic AMP receptor protein